jgi:hypothetical protein
MVTLTVERHFDAPPARVFDWLADSSNFAASPLVLSERRTRDGDGAPYGTGAIRQITALGAWFMEEITHYDPPYEYGYLIRTSFPPVRHEGGTVRVEPTPQGSKVTWTTQFSAPLGGPVEWGYKRVLSLAFGSILNAAEKELSQSK